MQEKEPVRVLVTAPLGVGGVTNMMINIQSHLDRSKVNFDYLVFHDRKEALEDKQKIDCVGRSYFCSSIKTPFANQ